MQVRPSTQFSARRACFRGRRAQLLCGAVIAAGGVLAQASPASAQGAAPAEVGEVIVTANRRAQDVTTIPYNISAVGGEQLARTGVTTIQDLSKQVPNLNIGNNGSRYLVAQVPIIRGLNASGTIRPAALAQPPVATYLGNVVVGGYFPIDDVERIEILRGPQGTLYGAGSLGGTIRIIPAQPEFSGFSGHVVASAGLISHSKDIDRSIAAVVNVPISETLALRLSAKQKYDGGYIDQVSIMATDGLLGRPILANPTDVANSPAVYYAKKDINWARSTNARAALRWKPTEALDVNLAFNYSSMEGEGGPTDNPYGGGPSPIDPRITIPPVGEYEAFVPTREPWVRNSRMASLDVSYDAGFATLSSTTSYLTTRGRSVADSTLGYIAIPLNLHQYYIGNPRNPRFYATSVRDDGDNTFAQEVRLVSAASESFEYTAGLYYENKKQYDTWHIYSPGTMEQTIASGGFFVFTDPLGRFVALNGDSEFTEEAAFGELTWHVTPRWQVTAGGRLFHQKFTRTEDTTLFTFFLKDTAKSTSKVTDHIIKVNTSYEFADNHNIYATFSQGFRRGGANAFALDGFLAEPPSLLAYKPDKVDNYELGVKGRLRSGWSYTADIFYDDWKNPQIDLITPANGWPVVVNGSKAKSKGVEIELSGPITDELRLVFGYAYANAEVSQDFCLATGDGTGAFNPCGIQGVKGGRLPGSPRHSAAATLNYDHTLANEDTINLTLNVNYKGTVLSLLPSPFTVNTLLDSYWLVNASASYSHGPWRASIYAQNMFDERAVLGAFSKTNVILGDSYNYRSVTTPRQVGLSLQYSF